MSEGTEVKQSEFNAGIAKLMRIDALKKACHIARNSDDLKLWFNCLEGIREEICERMDVDEDKLCNKYEIKILQFINDSKFKDISVRNLKNYGMELAKIEYKYGFSMPDKEDDDGL